MQRLFGILKSWLWHADSAYRPWYLRWITSVGRYVFGLARDIGGGQLSLHAMSLVYSTLLAAVPLIAFSFSVLKGLNVHTSLEPLLYEVLEPLGEEGVQITSQIMTMVNKVSGGVLGGVSLTLFLYTAISMVQKVETSFNYVWHVHQPRSLSRRILDYTTVLLIGTLMMALTLASLASLRYNTYVQAITQTSWFSLFWLQVGKALPFILVTLLFSALYKWMPNTRVNPVAALFGGVVAGCLWAITGTFFADFVGYSSRTLIIYASFAIAVTTLLWLYANWLILLLGARLAFYYQNREYLRIGRHDPRLSSATRERLALEIMCSVGEPYVHGAGGASIADIAERLRLPSVIVEEVASELADAALIVSTDREV